MVVQSSDEGHKLYTRLTLYTAGANSTYKFYRFLSDYNP